MKTQINFSGFTGIFGISSGLRDAMRLARDELKQSVNEVCFSPNTSRGKGFLVVDHQCELNELAGVLNRAFSARVTGDGKIITHNVEVVVRANPSQGLVFDNEIYVLG